MDFQIYYMFLGILTSNFIGQTHGKVTDEQMANISPSNRPNCKPGATKPNIQVNTTARLHDLRQLFNVENIEAYLIPSEDAHQSEYTSEYDARRQFITGFDGSYGKAVVFRDKAAFWTDGRYFLQAEDQLDCNWILMKQDEVGVPSVEEYVIFVLKSVSNKRYGANTFLVGSRRSWQNKILDMHAAMDSQNVDFMIITGLDETACVIMEENEDCYCLYLVDHERKLTQNPSDSMTKSTLAEHLNTGNTGSCVGRTGLCVENKIYQSNTPVALQKAQKNAVEREGMKNAHIRDAVALITFVAKLEKEVKEGKRWTEVSAAEELKKHRLAQKYNRGLSFPSISSSGSNGAVIHYFPTPATDKQITTNEMYLLDSGGQYL
ncbi:hypothetical protein KUTeg_007954 [Tegillarca granosa]|uniref:Uncharacterized protein n=1 Tax=Tegillarca granosa TaxID=220873 RepID=A0ABQ9FEQ3_TEGGR|nr:hypothetical protein KUTeg_007954 [Tegillarca granosa]